MTASSIEGSTSQASNPISRDRTRWEGALHALSVSEDVYSSVFWNEMHPTALCRGSNKQIQVKCISFPISGDSQRSTLPKPWPEDVTFAFTGETARSYSCHKIGIIGFHELRSSAIIRQVPWTRLVRS